MLRRSISSIIDNAFEVFGLDRNGIMCDNILAYLPYVKVLLSNGKIVAVEAVRFICYEQALVTYNFEVEDFHTYYVGNGVLVHNKGCGIGGHGWEGDSTWRANVKRVSQGGDILELKGGIPTQTQAEKLIQQAK